MREITQQWIILMKQDLQAAEILLDAPDLTNVVLFHCQQAIEKSLKSVLEESNLAVPKIHNVIKLYDLIPDNAKKVIQFSDDEMDLINEIYINIRYPSDLGLVPEGLPSRTRAQETYDIASRILIQTLKYLECD